MSYSPTTIHLIALAVTLGVEGAGMALWARVANLRFWRAVGCGLIVNLVVHTLFWFTQSSFATDGPLSLYRAELLVVLLEGAAYARLLRLRGPLPWLLSLLLNAASLLIGLWLWQSPFFA